MYSVIRFTIDSNKLHNLLAVGEDMNRIEPGIFAGPRCAGDGFSCDIESSALWEDHREELLEFLGLHEASVRTAVALGAQVTVDVAIEPEDQAAQKHLLALSASAALLAALGGLGVCLEISIYRPQLAADAT